MADHEFDAVTGKLVGNGNAFLRIGAIIPELGVVIF